MMCMNNRQNLSISGMIEHYYDTEYGQVKVEEHFPPFSDEFIAKVAKFVEENPRREYNENYSMDELPGSLGTLLKNNKLASAQIAYLDGKFQFFMASRIAEDTGMYLVCVRLFSSLENVKKPIHTAFSLRLQMEHGKKLGFSECSMTMNVGVRDRLAELVKKRYLKYPHTPNSIKAVALENLSKFEYIGIRVINYCEQHVFTAKLT